MLSKLATIVVAGALSAQPVQAATAGAPPTTEAFGASVLALPASDLALPAPDLVTELAPSVEAVAFVQRDVRVTRTVSRTGVRLEASRYRPRRSYPPPDVHHPPRGPEIRTPFQIHGGFFELDGDASPYNFVAGLRGGPAFGPQAQMAFGADWIHNSEKERVLTGEPYEQGGVTVVPQRELASTKSDLVPITANLQVNLSRSGLIPYIGVGGGYQLLWLSAQDFETGEAYDATFGGWMWQLFGGVQLPLGGGVRLLGEAFLHEGDAERDVEDITGVTYREVVKLDGAGMRFGLTWGY